jgi:hypothetical protein
MVVEEETLDVREPSHITMHFIKLSLSTSTSCKNSPEFDDEFQGNLIIGVCNTQEFQGFAIVEM